MTLVGILRKLSIILVALVALFLSRTGISYLIILVCIGIFTPFLSGNKKGAVFSGILYSTFSYILSFPTGSYLINYMPSIDIPITVNSFDVFMNLFIGWLIPVLISILVCGIASLIGKFLLDLIIRTDNQEVNEHYFESDESYSKNYLNTKGNIELLNLTSIQKAKNRKQKNNEE